MPASRTLFTFDVNLGASYYWDRPGDKQEYNGGVALIYLRKLTPRAQFTASASASYQSQPDFSQINVPTSNNRGSYLTANAKADLSYRLTPRFSTVTSVSYNTLLAVEESEQSGNYGETTFGTELRYLLSPRVTLLGELRYSSSIHEEGGADDANTYFLLVGGELTLTRRFTATLRVGEALRTFSETGEKSSSPYAEATLGYRLARRTTIQWNARYGYEEAAAPNTTVIVARTGLSLSHIFSPRLQGTLALNALRSTTTTTSEQVDPGIGEYARVSTGNRFGIDRNDDLGGAGRAKDRERDQLSLEQDTIDATLAFQYALSRRWSLNLSYSYTMVIGPEKPDDYYRQRVFLGAAYVF